MVWTEAKDLIMLREMAAEGVMHQGHPGQKAKGQYGKRLII